VAASELPRAEQRELEPQGTWRPRSCPGLAAGAGAAGHVAAPELPRAGQRELEPQDTWRPRSCPGLGSGSWSRTTRGGPGAALGYAVHVEVMDTREHVICMPRLCLDLELVRGGTWSIGFRHIGNLNKRVTHSSRSTHLSYFSNTLFVALFEPQDVGHTLSDLSSVNAMHEELENFERNQV
jgi:hypothetical protein